MSSVPRGPGLTDTRLRGGILLAVVLALLVLLVAWWWAFAGEGRARFRSAEPTPADAAAPAS